VKEDDEDDEAVELAGEDEGEGSLRRSLATRLESLRATLVISEGGVMEDVDDGEGAGSLADRPSRVMARIFSREVAGGSAHESMSSR
jgi:hypothetical protein